MRKNIAEMSISKEEDGLSLIEGMINVQNERPKEGLPVTALVGAVSDLTLLTAVKAIILEIRALRDNKEPDPRKGIKERDLQIYDDYYKNGLDLLQIGAKHGLTRERVRQIRCKVERMLKAREEKNEMA